MTYFSSTRQVTLDTIVTRSDLRDLVKPRTLREAFVGLMRDNLHTVCENMAPGKFVAQADAARRALNNDESLTIGQTIALYAVAYYEAAHTEWIAVPTDADNDVWFASDRTFAAKKASIVRLVRVPRFYDYL